MGPRKTTLSILTVVVLVGCGDDNEKVQDAGPRDAAIVDVGVTDGGSAVDGAGACPTSFTACGGNVVGVWSLDVVCPAGGESLTRPCSHPYEDLQACSGSANQARCTNVYGGTVTLAADGSSTVDMSVHAEMKITFDEACVLAVANGTPMATACPTLTTPNGKQLDCKVEAGLCQCSIKTEPETETVTDVYQVSGTDLTINPNNGETMFGPYCVTSDEMVIRGVVGWAYWVLHRTK
jgi:hypothetical protein